MTFIALSGALVPGPLHAQHPRGFRAEDLHELASVGQARVSPDGRHVACAVSTSRDARAPVSTLRVVDLRTGAHSELGRGSSPRWSPDGRWLLYSGSDAEGSGLFVSRIDGRERKAVARPESTNHP